MKYELQKRWRQIRVPVLGAGGAAAGLIGGELSSELTSRVLGYTGYKKAGVKTAVKGLVGALLFGASAIPGAAPFTLPAAFASWGSSVLDWIAARFPGGIPGIAERLAVTLRTWSMGAEKVAAELSALEKIEAGASSPSAGQTAMVWA